MWTKLKDWLLSWLPKRSAQPADRFDLYKPHERLIYSYFDGKDVVSADPMTIWKRYSAVSTDLAADIRLANMKLLPQPEKDKATSKMLGRIRTIFNVKPYEEGGLTELETNDLFDHFMIFCGVQKKTGSPPPTSPGDDPPSTSPPTAPSGDGGSPPSSPTGNTSASGSTANESSSEPSPPSPTAPESTPAESSPESTTTSP